MDKNMLDRLVTSEKRVEEIDALLSEPNITSDLKRFKELNKERSILEPIVDKFHEYKTYESNLKDALDMSNDLDPEISALGREEYKNNQDLMEKTEEEIKILLLPRDPNDGKDVIFEIKGAVGGDEADIFAGDLFRMYIKYCDSKGFKYKSMWSRRIFLYFFCCKW